MNRLYRSAIVGLTACFVLAMTAVAWSDPIVNNLDATADAAAETATTTAGVPASVGFSVVASNTDPSGSDASGCNATGSAPAVLTITPPAGVSVTPSTLTFVGCGNVVSASFSAASAGTYAFGGGAFSLTGGKSGSLWNTSTAAFTLQVDPVAPTNTPPSVSVTGVTDGASYEIGSVPAAGCSVVDAEDGNSTFAAALSAITGPLSTYGLGSQTASCSHTDGGGLTASASATYAIVDTTPPVITFVSRLPAANGFGWNDGDVTVTWACSDAGSGVVETSVSETVSTEGAGQSVTGTCEDHAGNTASDTVGDIDIDRTPPSVSLVGGPADGASYYFGSVPAAPTCDASDALSGLVADCSVAGYSGAVGTHTVTASAADRAGNGASDTATYTVLAWTLYGFSRPVDMGGVLNVVKGGSTVPLKFEVFAGPTELTDPAVVDSLTQAKVACDGSAPTDVIEATATGGTSLRYDEVAGQFVYNWQSPKLPGQCYRVTMQTLDGSSLVALFKLK